MSRRARPEGLKPSVPGSYITTCAAYLADRREVDVLQAIADVLNMFKDVDPREAVGLIKCLQMIFDTAAITVNIFPSDCSVISADYNGEYLTIELDCFGKLITIRWKAYKFELGREEHSTTYYLLEPDITTLISEE